MHPYIEQQLKHHTGAVAVEEKEVIQSLWSGYGAIVRVALTGGSVDSLIVKNIDLNAITHQPRGWNTNNSHQRKVKSYEVEMHWYNEYNTNETEGFRTANCLFSWSDKNNHYIILEDLDFAGFPVRKQHLNLAEAKACIKWLAHFHGYYMEQQPVNLWQEGTYWHLNTRPDEFKAMKNGPLKQNASKIDAILKSTPFQTLVHGDAKVANFCFSENGHEVAAVDFQYVGGGCGMKDLAYFVGSCFSEDECALYETEILNYYFQELKAALSQNNTSIDFKNLESDWRNMYSLAWADFSRFLMGWMPTHQKLHGYSLHMVKKALETVSMH